MQVSTLLTNPLSLQAGLRDLVGLKDHFSLLDFKRIWVWLAVSLSASLASSLPVLADLITPTDGLKLNQPEVKSVPIEQTRLADLQPAIDAFKQGDQAKFKEAYQAAEGKSDTLPHLSVFLAKLQIEAGRVDLAFNTLEQHLMASPSDPEGYLALGEIALRSNRLTDAWLQFQHTEALIAQGELRPSRLPLIQLGLIELMAETAERRQQFAEAKKMWDQMLALKPELPLAVWRLGRLKVMQGELDAGVEAMRKAYAKDNKLPCPELVAALMMAEKQDKPIAEKWFQEAIKANKTDAVRWTEYFKWLLLNDRAADVQKTIAKLSAETMANRNLRFLKGVTARYTGDLQTAELVFAELHRESPDDLEAADQLALVLVENADEGKRARAFQLSESNLRKAPNQEGTIATAAWVQFKLGDIDVADRLLGQLAAQTALSPQTAYYVSEVLKARGKTEEARQVLKAAVESPGIFPAREVAKRELAK